MGSASLHKHTERQRSAGQGLRIQFKNKMQQVRGTYNEGNGDEIMLLNSLMAPNCCDNVLKYK